MRSRTTATASSSSARARRGLRPFLAIVALAAVMLAGPIGPAGARGAQETDPTTGAAPAAGTADPATPTPEPEPANSESAPPETEPATLTDTLVDTPCPCSGRDATDAVPFSVLASGANAAQQKRLAALATSQEEFEDLWSRVARTRVPQPDPPEVRFDSQIAVAIFMGQQPSGGYSIAIDTACRVEARGTVHLCYTAYEPPEDAIVTMALTSPYTFVLIDEPAADIVVHRRSATR